MGEKRGRGGRCEPEPKRMRQTGRGDQIGQPLPLIVQRGGDQVKKVLFIADDGGTNGLAQIPDMRLDQGSVSEEECLENRRCFLVRVKGGRRG